MRVHLNLHNDHLGLTDICILMLTTSLSDLIIPLLDVSIVDYQLCAAFAVSCRSVSGDACTGKCIRFVCTSTVIQSAVGVSVILFNTS